MGHLIAATSSGGGGLFLLVLLFLYVLFTVPVWGTYQKASPTGDPAWSAFVPIYNFIILLRIAGKPRTWAWFLLLNLVPYVGSLAFFIISIVVLNGVSKNFGHGGGFTAGLVLLPIIFWFILWLGKSQFRPVPSMAAGYGGYPPTGYPQGGYPPPPPPGAGYPPPPPGAGYPPPPRRLRLPGPAIRLLPSPARPIRLLPRLRRPGRRPASRRRPRLHRPPDRGRSPCPTCHHHPRRPPPVRSPRRRRSREAGGRVSSRSYRPGRRASVRASPPWPPVRHGTR